MRARERYGKRPRLSLTKVVHKVVRGREHTATAFLPADLFLGTSPLTKTAYGPLVVFTARKLSHALVGKRLLHAFSLSDLVHVFLERKSVLLSVPLLVWRSLTTPF